MPHKRRVFLTVPVFLIISPLVVNAQNGTETILTTDLLKLQTFCLSLRPFNGRGPDNHFFALPRIMLASETFRGRGAEIRHVCFGSVAVVFYGSNRNT